MISADSHSPRPEESGTDPGNSEPSTRSALRVLNLTKVYPDGTLALDKVTLNIEKGEIAAVIGPSGAGKSTLLRCVNGLIPHQSGSISVFGKDVSTRQGHLRRIRREIGMIYQTFNLVPRLSVMQNVLSGALGRTHTYMSLFYLFPNEEMERARSALIRVGIEDKSQSRAADLSGGQMQRVAIARAIVQEPRLLLADEPVSNLDPVIARSILEYIVSICREDGITAIINLHRVSFAKEFADRILGIADGRLLFDKESAAVSEDDLKTLYGDEYRED